MNIETLEKANTLQRKIRDYECASGCFKEEHPEDEKIVASREPRLAIEHIDEEWDERTITVLPDVLTKDFIDVIKSHIKSKIIELKKEFEML